MVTAREHYDDHLGPVYSWMLGDLEARTAEAERELRELGLRPGATASAVDLGAGPGVHAIPLARLGFSVTAIDTCRALLDELRSRAGDRRVRTVQDDLLHFRRHSPGSVDAILCMGDTLTHLPDHSSVETLLADVSEALSDPGVFVTTFRDYSSREVEGAKRFIPVRSDADRSLTCFLEYGEKTVNVYDLLHERGENGWELRVSGYPKLRLDPAWVVGRLTEAGLHCARDETPGGMVRIVARRDGAAA